MLEFNDLPAMQSAWRSVFTTNDPFTWPFAPAISAGRVFFPTDGYYLTAEQFSALGDAASRTGDEPSFLSIVEAEGLSFLHQESEHWTVDLASYDAYCQLDVPLESALYSRAGHWGVLVSHEMHALVGGSTDFVAALDESYGGWAQDRRMLIEYWSDNPAGRWVEQVLSRVDSWHGG